MLFLLAASLLAADPPSWADDCGLEPPGSYVPSPVGPKPYEQRWYPQDPPGVRKERNTGPRALSAPTASFKEQGALAGKVIYLSAGHGFTWVETLNAWRTQRGTTNEIVEDLVSTETVHQFLVPMLLNAGAQVITVRESDWNPNLVIVDDGSPGYVETGSGFSESTLPGWGAPPSPMLTGVNPFALAKNRLMDAAPAATARATYTASFPADGYYNAYVSYAAFTSRVTDAHYIVKHSGGESHFRVNQRRHGGTWILLGRFYFKKGTSAAVVVQNDSKDTGNVSLDAVRFGGGIGNIDRGGGVSGRPHFEECSRYYVQSAGAPTTVYDYSNTDGNDDVSARSRFAAWMHEPGEDAVYLAWHTNAFNASAVGTDVYVYGPNPPDGNYTFTGVPGSDKLAQFVHTELINDIRATTGWNRPTWTDRGIHSAYFGEINPSHNSEMPSILMEIAFHDAAADATSLKEPAFRYLATRAISQGIIRFFADKDGVAPKFPPEPPTHVAAVTQPGGMVKVSWRAPAVDTQGVFGAVPTKYRLYQSADGLGWDEGVDEVGLSFTLSLPVDRARYFRVASVNAGGESFASDVVGARLPQPGGSTVMVVNAFDRLDATLGSRDNLTSYALGQVLRIIIPKMNDASYLARWGDALDGAQVGFDSATSLAITSGDVSLAPYAMIGWMAGRGHVGGAGPSAGELTALNAHAQKGRPIFFTGTTALRSLAAGSATEKDFLLSVLRVGPTAAVNSQAAVTLEGFLAGIPALALDDGSAGAYDTGTTDITNLAPGTAIQLGKYGGGTPSALAADKKQVTFGFPFETITSRAARLEVMSRVVKYFEIETGTPRPDAGESDAGVDPVDGGPLPSDGGTLRLGVLPREYAAAPKGCGCSAEGALSPLLGLALFWIFRARSAR